MLSIKVVPGSINDAQWNKCDKWQKANTDSTYTGHIFVREDFLEYVASDVNDESRSVLIVPEWVGREACIIYAMRNMKNLSGALGEMAINALMYRSTFDKENRKKPFTVTIG